MVSNKFATAPKRQRTPSICHAGPPVPPIILPPPATCPTTWQSSAAFTVAMNMNVPGGPWVWTFPVNAPSTAWGSFYGEHSEPQTVGPYSGQGYAQLLWQTVETTCVYQLNVSIWLDASGFHPYSLSGWKSGVYTGGLPFTSPTTQLMHTPYTGSLAVTA